jgi:hypothetical protein
MAFRTLDDIATEAYVYLYPLVVMEATKQKMRAGSSAAGDPSMNLLSHQMRTATDKWRAVARPNINTLFSAAWVDLSDGPVVLSLPPAGERYHMFQLLDFWTDTFAVPGSRSNGQDGVRVRIVGPHWASAPGDVGDDIDKVDHVVKCPTPTMWVLGFRFRV